RLAVAQGPSTGQTAGARHETGIRSSGFMNSRKKGIIMDRAPDQEARLQRTPKEPAMDGTAIPNPPLTQAVLITGASYGLGYELAQCFAADRHALILVARSGERLDAVASELRAAHGIAVDTIAM